APVSTSSSLCLSPVCDPPVRRLVHPRMPFPGSVGETGGRGMFSSCREDFKEKCAVRKAVMPGMRKRKTPLLSYPRFYGGQFTGAGLETRRAAGSALAEKRELRAAILRAVQLARRHQRAVDARLGVPDQRGHVDLDEGRRQVGIGAGRQQRVAVGGTGAEGSTLEGGDDAVRI